MSKMPEIAEIKALKKNAFWIIFFMIVFIWYMFFLFGPKPQHINKSYYITTNQEIGLEQEISKIIKNPYWTRVIIDNNSINTSNVKGIKYNNNIYYYTMYPGPSFDPLTLKKVKSNDIIEIISFNCDNQRINVYTMKK